MCWKWDKGGRRGETRHNARRDKLCLTSTPYLMVLIVSSVSQHCHAPALPTSSDNGKSGSWFINWINSLFISTSGCVHSPLKTWHRQANLLGASHLQPCLTLLIYWSRSQLGSCASGYYLTESSQRWQRWFCFGAREQRGGDRENIKKVCLMYRTACMFISYLKLACGVKITNEFGSTSQQNKLKAIRLYILKHKLFKDELNMATFFIQFCFRRFLFIYFIFSSILVIRYWS